VKVKTLDRKPVQLHELGCVVISLTKIHDATGTAGVVSVYTKWPQTVLTCFTPPTVTSLLTSVSELGDRQSALFLSCWQQAPLLSAAARQNHTQTRAESQMSRNSYELRSTASISTLSSMYRSSSSSRAVRCPKWRQSQAKCLCVVPLVRPFVRPSGLWEGMTPPSRVIDNGSVVCRINYTCPMRVTMPVPVPVPMTHPDSPVAAAAGDGRVAVVSCRNAELLCLSSLCLLGQETRLPLR